jgi:eukaryotic-like serine/threonine-protein kinase
MTREGQTGDQAWLAREAQALARLSHPNVIAVHDVGTLPGDRVFVAMELVEGPNLRQWLKQPRDWRQIREVMTAAGAGLAAAHNAGLIHRDFKPENVLVGNDGRVRVMDFGLARLQAVDEPPAARDSDLQIETRSPLSESLTIAGSVVGTPAYMAPEIYDGVGASARSDQFAFGVTLYELLHGTRPYAKKAFAPPRAPDLAPKEPPKSDVPQRLHRIAVRAIAIDPATRFASMDALLAELAIDPTAARRRALLAGGGAVALAGVVIATMKLTAGSSEPAQDLTKLCKGSERHLAGVWDPTVKQTVRDAFEATRRPFKGKALTAIETTLDRYAKEWTTAVTESCEATRLRGEQTEDVLSLRQDCLDQRLAVLRAFTQQLVKADDILVDKASNAALDLERSERIAQCADVAALKTPTQPSAAIRPAYNAARMPLAEARAAILTGNIGRAINQSTAAIKLARDIPFDPLIAEGELIRGMAMLQIRNPDEAQKSLGEATWAGLRGKRDDLAAEAALYAAITSSELLDKNSEGRIWMAIGKAATLRAGNDPVMRLRALETEGIVLATSGELVTAVAAHEQALVLGRQIFSASSTQLARPEQVLGATLSRLGDYHRARPHYERALELSIQLLGPDHPDVGLMHSGLASALHYTGDLPGSRKQFERALEIREKVFGKDSPVLIATLNNMAELMRDMHDPTTGLALIIRARTIVNRSVGRNHPYYVTINATHGELLLAAGKIAEAKAAYGESLVAAEAQKSTYVAAVLAGRAEVARAETKWAEAATYDERSIAAFEKLAGTDAIDLYKPLTGLAIDNIELGKLREAKPLLDRARAIAEKNHVPELLLATLRATIKRLDQR